jgi:hypothetical protein
LVNSSYGYTGTRLNPSSLVGQSVRFRFRVGTDFVTSSSGWLVDNVAIYRCTVPPTVVTHPVSQTVEAGGTATFTAAATGTPAPTVHWQVSTDGGSTWTNISGATSTTYSFTVEAGDNGRRGIADFLGDCWLLLGSVTVPRGLSRRRSRVRVPSAPPSVLDIAPFARPRGRPRAPGRGAPAPPVAAACRAFATSRMALSARWQMSMPGIATGITTPWNG